VIRAEVVSSTRLAGQVKRYHTWPVLHPQSVGEHTWQTMRLYWELYGHVEPEVCAYLLWHDAPELVTGDPPFPTKANNPALKAIYDEMEDAALTNMVGAERATEILDGVTSLQRLRMKACDLIDMYEFGMHELAMGNRYGEPIVADTRAALLRLAQLLPASEQSIVEKRVGINYNRTGAVGI